MTNTIASITLRLCLFLAASCTSESKEKKEDTKDLNAADIPAPVKVAFGAKYSTATDIKWEDAHEEKKQTFKAKFQLNGKKMKAEFDVDGNLIKEKEND